MRKGATGNELATIKQMLADGKSAEEVSRSRDVNLDFVKSLLPRKIKETAPKKAPAKKAPAKKAAKPKKK